MVFLTQTKTGINKYRTCDGINGSARTLETYDHEAYSSKNQENIDDFQYVLQFLH